MLPILFDYFCDMFPKTESLAYMIVLLNVGLYDNICFTCGLTNLVRLKAKI